MRHIDSASKQKRDTVNQCSKFYSMKLTVSPPLMLGEGNALTLRKLQSQSSRIFFNGEFAKKQ